MLKGRSIEGVSHGYTERLFIESELSNGVVRIVDNFLDTGEVYECEDHNLLRWRVAPSKVGAPGRLGRMSEFVPFGKLMFFPAKVPCQTRPFNQTEQNRSIVCGFRNELDDMLSELNVFEDREQLKRCLDINHGRIDVTMQRIGQELTHPGFASELLLESFVTALAIDIARFFDEEIDLLDEVERRPCALSEVHLRRITDYIISAREGVPTSSKLAELCGMSASSFRQRFKQTTGQSIHAYVEEVRLNRAKSYLTDTSLSMKEIAYELGFTHQATFTTSFRRATGMAPSEYRRRN